MDEKRALRKRCKTLRDGLSPTARTEKSLQVWERLREMEDYRRAGKIFAFTSFGCEVDTAPIIVGAVADGKVLAVPAVSGEDMAFFRKGTERGTRRSAFGVEEPFGGEIVYPDRDTLILMPGLAFGRDMYRIGYGGGYYDRFLANALRLRAVGIAFHEQIVDSTPHAHYDVPLDYIVTDRAVLYSAEQAGDETVST